MSQRNRVLAGGPVVDIIDGNCLLITLPRVRHKPKTRNRQAGQAAFPGGCAMVTCKQVNAGFSPEKVARS